MIEHKNEKETALNAANFIDNYIKLRGGAICKLDYWQKRGEAVDLLNYLYQNCEIKINFIDLHPLSGCPNEFEFCKKG
jgi:hypothetical protein